MALYESTFIVRQDLSSQDVEKVTDTFAQIVKDCKGKVVNKEYWGLRNLAYKVKKNKKGHYVILFIDIPSVDELQRQYKLSEDVIRYLNIKVEEFPKEATPLARQGGAKPAGTKKVVRGDRR